MLSSNVARAINRGRPGVPFEFSSEGKDTQLVDLSNLIWPDTAGPPPTLQEVITWDAEAQTEIDNIYIEQNVSRDDIITQYQVGMTRLNAIITNGPTYTQVQVRDAMVDLAKIQRQMLRVIRSTMP